MLCVIGCLVFYSSISLTLLQESIAQILKIIVVVEKNKTKKCLNYVNDIKEKNI